MNEKLNYLIKLAQGDRSQNAYESKCGLGSGTLTRIIKDGQLPTPETLKKISSAAHNGVTYNDLMKAAGHLHDDLIENAADIVQARKVLQEERTIKDEDIQFALFGGKVTPEAYEEVLKFAQYIKDKEEKERQKIDNK